MIKVESKNIFVWLIIMLMAWFLFSVSFGAFFGLFVGLKLAGPIAVELSTSDDIGNIKNETDLTEGQINEIEKKTIEKMREVNWWFWWPFLSILAWLITSIFLGLMKVVKFNEGLIIITYIISYVQHGKEWKAPGNIIIEVLTILLALSLVHYMSRWICSKRVRA